MKLGNGEEITLFHIYAEIGEDAFFEGMLKWKLAGRDQGQWAHFPGYKPERWQTLFMMHMGHFQAWMQLQMYKAQVPTWSFESLAAFRARMESAK